MSKNPINNRLLTNSTDLSTENTIEKLPELAYCLSMTFSRLKFLIVIRIACGMSNVNQMFIS